MAIGSAAVSLNRSGPVISYTSLDFASVKQDLINYAQANYSDRWTDFNPDQFAVVFLDILSYQGDLLTYYLNSSLRELNVQTAQRRQSLVQLAKTYDYQLRSASPSSGDLMLITATVNLPASVLTTHKFAAGDIVFQPVQASTLTTENGTDNGDGTYTHTIAVVQGEEFATVALGTSDGSREQVYALTQTPLIDGTLTVTVDGVVWIAVTSFTASEPESQHYRVETNDSDETYIFFGDNVNGKAPPASQVVAATWKTGGGRVTNVGADTITTIVTAITGVSECTNPAAFTGGEDQETATQARSAIPKSLAAGDRAVTADDYATIAKRATSSVAKAFARVEADQLTVEILVAPAGGGYPTETLLGEVAGYVNARRMIGRRIRCSSCLYMPVEIHVDVYVSAATDRTAIQAVLEELLLTSDASAVQDGVFDYDNVGFGGRDDTGAAQLTLQRIYDLINNYRYLGVQHSKITRLANKPFMRPIGVVVGDGTLSSFITNDEMQRRRRQWRVVFTSSTEYVVFERVIGENTLITSSQLVDDRAPFPGGFPSGTVVCPNLAWGTVFAVRESGSNTTTITKDPAESVSFLNVASRGDSYYVEFTPQYPLGTVGVSFQPSPVAGVAWVISAGSTPFGVGDQFLITQTAGVADLLVLPDEIPSMAAADRIITVKSAL